jgi:uncharacterized membrane protein YesL
VLYAAGQWLPAFLLLAPLQALPTVGIFRMAALIARGDAVALSDAFRAWRAYLWPALAAGIVVTVLSVLFFVNIAIGLGSGTLIGVMFATFAGWALLILWSGALTFWPLLADPRRAGESLRSRFRLALILLLAHPVRLGVLLLVVAILLAISTVLFAALLTVSVAFVALVVSRYVLAVADRFEGRATELVLE